MDKTISQNEPPIFIDKEGNRYYCVPVKEVIDQKSGRIIQPDSDRKPVIYLP